MIVFTVHGVPAPKGSTTRMPNGAVLHGASKGAREKLRDWSGAVAQASHEQADLTGQMTGAVHVEIEFRFPMPKSRPVKVQRDGFCWKQTTPDVDKLLRSTLDGLVAGGLLRDDALVASVEAIKIEVNEHAPTGGWTGAMIRLEELA